MGRNRTPCRGDHLNPYSPAMSNSAATNDPEGWFPVSQNDTPGWRLDIVSLLAVIGESSLAEHYQPMTASWFGCLPRLVPAPQVLLKPTRPTRLPQVNAVVVGVKSGVYFTTLNYFPSILHPLENLPAYSFTKLKISHNAEKKAKRKSAFEKSRARHLPQREAGGISAEKKNATTTARDIEDPSRPMRRRSTMRDMKDALVETLDRKSPPHVPAKTLSPLNVLSAFSFVVTCGLLAQSVQQKDGVACIAISVISLASVVVGYASLWSPVLMPLNKSPSDLPKGDIVIRTREGAFLVVECSEEVARELYSGTEECKYVVKSSKSYRALIGLGTFLVMVSVVLLGNCNFNQQASIGGAYILLNGCFWGASLLDKKRFWDLTLYEIEELEKIMPPGDEKPVSSDKEERPSYTRAMWLAIKATKSVGWVKKSGAAPNTTEWDTWLNTAQEEVKKEVINWRAVQAKDDLVGQTDPNEPGSPVADADIHGIKVPAGQQAPAIEVPRDLVS